MEIEEYNTWVLNNLLEFEPEDLEKDCWIPKKSIGRVRKVRAIAHWNGRSYLMYHLTYMSWHGLQESPFSQGLHASHTCENAECVNPLHIVPETASANENAKKNREGWDTFRKLQRERRQNRKVEMPRNLTHREKAEWFLENKTWTDENGCMRWTGQTDEKGYGRHNITISVGKVKKVEIHRYIYCMMNDLPYGEDPANAWNAKGKGFKVADHICNQPNCVNPEHIQLISRRENSLRAIRSKKGF
jgi:hypothetical protein